MRRVKEKGIHGASERLEEKFARPFVCDEKSGYHKEAREDFSEGRTTRYAHGRG